MGWHRIESCELLYSVDTESANELCNSGNYYIHLKVQKSLKGQKS